MVVVGWRLRHSILPVSLLATLAREPGLEVAEVADIIPWKIIVWGRVVTTLRKVRCTKIIQILPKTKR